MFETVGVMAVSACILQMVYEKIEKQRPVVDYTEENKKFREQKEQEAKETFGDVKEITAGVDGEFAFVTGRMSEKEFNEKAEKVGVISRIRFA
jgi:DNA-binding protein H-NS